MDKVDCQVVHIRHVAGRAGLCGLAMVRFGEITVRDWRIIKNEQGIYFCALPASIVSEGGYEVRRSLIKIDPDLKQMVFDKILQKWNEREGLKFERGAEVEKKSDEKETIQNG